MKKILFSIKNKKLIKNFNDHFNGLIKINESLNLGAANNYRKMGCVYVDVPEIVGITGACENVDTLFKVQNQMDLPLFFTQTGQLSLEQSLQSQHGVFTVIHSGRDEEKEDKRHLRQFRLTEEEFDCTLAKMQRNNYDEDKMFTALLDRIEKTVKAMVKKILTDNEKLLLKEYGRKTNKLKKMLTTKFLKISYRKAIKLLQKQGFKKLKFGDDLEANHEAVLIKLLNKKNEEIPLFITKYPKEIKFFNMKVYTKDPEVVLSADLIFPYAGEGVGSAVREHNFFKLKKRLITSTMFKLHKQRGGKYEDFLWYLNIVKKKATLPHAGYGIGNERVLQYILALDDIRYASLFSLLNMQTNDWSKKRYGQGGIFSSAKKYILLSIGKIKNKKFLLPFLKKLAKKPDFVFYATEKTYQFLKANKINASLVYKISEIGKTPNIADLLQRRIFDIIINIPTREKIKNSKEFTDGKLIRKGAVRKGIHLVTDPEVAVMVIQGLLNGS